MTSTAMTSEAFTALVAERDALRDQLRTVTVERDLLKEKLAAQLRQLFAARSEARGAEQKDIFLNEAEAPVAEEADTDSIEIAGHVRKKRGRKPLDPNLPCDIVRHELPESAPSWSISGSRSASSST